MKCFHTQSNLATVALTLKRVVLIYGDANIAMR